MDLKYLNALVDELNNSGSTKPIQLSYLPTQNGFSDVTAHNKGVADLTTDLTSILTLADKLTTGVRSYNEGCRELEGWVEDRLEDLRSKRKSSGFTTLEFKDPPHLPVNASIPLVPLSKEVMPSCGRVISSKGPWRQVASEGETTVLGATVASRWRLRFEREVPVSEVNLSSSAEIFGLYRVIRAKVISASPLMIDQRIPGNPEVIVDVTHGFHHGFWFTTTARGNLLDCDIELDINEEITVAIPASSYEMGRGIYEVEDNYGPVWGDVFDIVLGGSNSTAWLGMPAPQLSFKIYSPKSEVQTIGEVEPTDLVKLHVEQIVPTGSTITYEVVPDENLDLANSRILIDGTSLTGAVIRRPRKDPAGSSIRNREPKPIVPDTALFSSDLFSPVHCVEETSLDRFLSAELTWAPVVSGNDIHTLGLGYNPNIKADTRSRSFYEDWVLKSGDEDKGSLRQDRWIYSGAALVTLWGITSSQTSSTLISYEGGSTGSGGAAQWGYSDEVSLVGSLSPDYPCLRLDGGSEAHLRSTFWPYSSYYYRTFMRFVSSATLASITAAAVQNSLYAGDCADFRVRESESGDSLSLRVVPAVVAGADILAIGLYQISGAANEVAVTIGTLSLEVVSPSILGSLAHAVIPPDLIAFDYATQHSRYSGLTVGTEVYRGFTWFTLYVEPTSSGCDYKIRVDLLDNSGYFPTSAATIALLSSNLEAPTGGGLSIRNNFVVGASLGTLDIGITDVVSSARLNPPVQVEAFLDGVSIPADSVGTDIINLRPESFNETITPNVDGSYTLSASPASRWSGFDDVTVKLVDFEGTIGDTVYAGEAVAGRGKVTISGNTLRLRGVNHDGAINVEYWGIPQITGKVPFTYNTTDYLSSVVSRTLKPAEVDPNSDSYYPVFEYLHNGRQLYFANQLDSVRVAYDTYASFLRTRATLKRGINPCRSPRITSGYWELA